MNKLNEIISEKPLYINASEKDAAETLGLEIFRLGSSCSYNEIVILCIGTDRATGDSLGPLAGYFLSSAFDEKPHFSKKISVYGTLDDPVHARNLKKTINFIYRKYKNPLVIAIDACLGRTSHIGYLSVGKGSLTPGAGVGKVLPPAGDIYVTGIVNFGGIMELQILQNTRLNIVMKMAKVVSDGLYFCLNMIKDSEE